MMKILDTISGEPALFTAFMGAVFVAATEFGLDLTATQENAVTGVVLAVVGLVIRKQVVPVVRIKGDHEADN